MNIIVQNKRGLEFDLCDLDVRITHYTVGKQTYLEFCKLQS